MGFNYQIDPTSKTIDLVMEGHDIGEEGVHYQRISTANYNNMEELLEDNFQRIDDN